MPIPKNHHDFPAPSGTLANLNRVTPGAVDPSRLARMWRPVAGALMEGVLSTLSRFALRLIDRTDGNAYSADELEAKVIGQTAKRSAGTPVAAVAATGAFRIASLPAAGMTMQVKKGDLVLETFTFQPSAVEDFDVAIGVDEDATASNVSDAIAAFSAYLSAVMNVSPDTVDITLQTAGIYGNGITFFNANDPVDVIESTDTAGGVDATPATAGDQLIDANFLYTALVDMDVTATTGWLKSAAAAL